MLHQMQKYQTISEQNFYTIFVGRKFLSRVKIYRSSKFAYLKKRYKKLYDFYLLKLQTLNSCKFWQERYYELRLGSKIFTRQELLIWNGLAF